MSLLRPEAAVHTALAVKTPSCQPRPPPPTAQPPTAQVQARLDALFVPGGGPLKPDALDDRCRERLAEVGAATALTVLEVFAQKKWASLRLCVFACLRRAEHGARAGRGGVRGFEPG